MKNGRKLPVATATLLLAPFLAAAQGSGPAPVSMPDEPAPAGQYKMRQSALPSQGVMKRHPADAPMVPKGPDLGAWWKNSEVVQEVGLSEQQVTQIEQTFYDHRLRLIDLKASVEREETKLQPLMEADTVNEAQIGPQIDKVLAARSALEKANVMMMLSIRKVLTVDQWKKLESLRHRREDRMQMKMEEESRLRRRMSPGATPPPAPRPPDEFDYIPDRP